MLEGFVQTASNDELARINISTEEIFDLDLAFLDDLVVDMACQFRETELFDNYEGLNTFLAYFNEMPETVELDCSQKEFVKSAARVYFYSQILGLGIEYLGEKVKGASLSPIGNDFVANVLFDLYAPNPYSDDMVSLVRGAYDQYLVDCNRIN